MNNGLLKSYQICIFKVNESYARTILERILIKNEKKAVGLRCNK